MGKLLHCQRHKQHLPVSHDCNRCSQSIHQGNTAKWRGNGDQLHHQREICCRRWPLYWGNCQRAANRFERFRPTWIQVNNPLTFGTGCAVFGKSEAITRVSELNTSFLVPPHPQFVTALGAAITAATSATPKSSKKQHRWEKSRYSRDLMQSLIISVLTVSYHETLRRAEWEAGIKAAAITVWRELREAPISAEYERR